MRFAARWMKNFALVLFAFTAVSGVDFNIAFGADVPQSFTLDGRLYSDAVGATPLQDASVAFTVQILDEDKVCVLYEESQVVNTLSTKGYFSMQVGTITGSASRTAGDSANSMANVFQNIGTINGKLFTNGSPCTAGAAAAKRRYVRIKIAPPSMGGAARTLSPDLTIDSVPNAIVAERAESLQGLRGTDVLKVNTASGSALSQTNLESLFTSATRFNSLTSVVDGTSTNYMRSNSASGAQLPVMAGAPTAPAPGSVWYDSSDNKLKFQTSVGPSIVGTGSGTVTSVGFTAPSELSVAGAPVTTAGTIAVTWATQTANKVFAAPDGVTGTPTFRILVANDVPNIPWTKITSMLPTTLLGYGITDAVRNVGGTPSVESGLNAAKGAGTTAGRVWISTDTREIYRDNGTTWDLIGSSSTTDATKLPLAGGTMTGPLVNNSNSAVTAVAVTQSGAGFAATFMGGNVGIGTSNPSTTLDVNGAATFRATAAPATAASQGKLYYDTATNKFRVSENNGTFVDLIGGGGSVTAVSSANTYLSVATGTTTPVLTLNVGVAANTVAAGDDSRITGALPAATAFAGDVSGVYSATSVDKIKGTTVAITTITSGNFLKYNGTNWVNSNLAAGDVTGALTYTPVNKAGDTMTGLLVLSADPAANLGASTKQYVDAVTTSSDSNFVRKDGTSVLSLDWDVDGAGAGTRKITGLAAPTVGDGAATKTYADTQFLTKTLPSAPAAGQNGQSLRWNNGGNIWEYYTAGAGGGDFMASGSVPMTGPLVNSSTSAAAAVAVTQSGVGHAATFMGGNVGIGTTTPGYRLDVAGNVNSTGQFSAGNGTTAAPAFVFSGSASTGIYLPAVREIGIVTFGAERMRFDSVGNVGIGTAAPSTTLDINGAATFRATTAPTTTLAQGKLYYDTAANKFKVSENNGAYVDLVGGGGTVTNVTSANSYLSVATGTTTPALTLNVGTAANTVAAGDDSRITGALPAATAFAGDVSGVYSATSVDKIKGTGVAITTITSGNFLKYNGTNWVNSNLAAGDVTGALTYTPVNKAGDTMTGVLNNTTAGSAINVTNDINIGGKYKIGTNSVLSVAGTNNLFVGVSAGQFNTTGSKNTFLGADTGANITIESENTFVGYNSDGDNGITNSTALGSNSRVITSNSLVLGGTGASAVNVGIGTQAPDYLLDVAGSGAGTLNVFRMRNSVATANGSAAQMVFAANTTGNGITNVAGVSGMVTDVATPYKGALIFSTASNAAPVERMRVDSAGNVGFGTTVPSTRLDINGAATFRATTAPTAVLAQGKLYYDNATNKFKVSENNGAYVDLVGGGGTVTSVSSANSYLSVATGTTTPALTLNVGTAANTVAAGDDSRITGALPAATAFAGDVSGVYSATSVDKIKGTGVAITTITSGNFLKYNGTNWVNSNLAAGDVTGALTYTPVNKAGDTMTGLLVLSADPAANFGASTKQYVDAVTTSSDSNFVRKDGTSVLSLDWDVDGAGAGTRKISGLAAPTVGDGAATKTYSDTQFITKTLPAAPAAGQNGQSIRWNNVGNVWEYYTPGTGTGDFLANGTIPMTGSLVNNTTSASSAVAVTQSGAGSAATFMGGNVGIGTTLPLDILHISKNQNANTGMFVENTNTTSGSSSSLMVSAGGQFIEVGILGPNTNASQINNGEAFIQSGGSSLAFWQSSVAPIRFINNSSETMRLTSGGNVGIGTNAPASKLSVTSSNSTADLTTFTGESHTFTDSGNMVADAAYSRVGNNTSMSVSAPLSALGWSADITGMNSTASYSGTVSNGNGVSVTGIQGIGTWSGTMSASDYATVVGGNFQATGNLLTGTVREHVGVQVLAVGAGTVNTGLLVSTVSTATTNYGIQIASPASGANNYSIYSNATAKSYFAGNVGIGTTAPGARLDVADTSTTASAIIVPRAGNFTGTTVNGMIRYNSTATLFEFYQNGAWVNYTTVSDGRLKTNVVPVTDALGIVNQLNPVFYDWDRSNPKASNFAEKHQVGFIAQEVEKVLPEVVNEGEDSYRSLEYGKIVSVVVAAVKELYVKVMGHDEMIRAQEREIASVKAQFDAKSARLEAENTKLKAEAEIQKQENAAMKARLDKIEKTLKSFP